MIERAIAFEFVRAATNGRTEPLVMVCETERGESVELFCKLSVGCDQGAINLTREAVSACLAADLGLPVPVPYFVEIPSALSATIGDLLVARRMDCSLPLAFGSMRANQFSPWIGGSKISKVLLPTAAATLVFDGIIQNPDRRIGNPNCLVRGDEIRLIDHELAFAHKLLLLWRAPWVLGGLQSLVEPANRHIFWSELVGQQIDFGPITTAWRALSDGRLREYVDIIPKEWAIALPEINAAVRLIADARDNIDSCIAEVRRILA